MKVFQFMLITREFIHVADKRQVQIQLPNKELDN